MENVTLSFNYDPSKLPEGFDPNTSEGKAALNQLFVAALLTVQKQFAQIGSEDEALIRAFTAEG